MQQREWPPLCGTDEELDDPLPHMPGGGKESLRKRGANLSCTVPEARTPGRQARAKAAANSASYTASHVELGLLLLLAIIIIIIIIIIVITIIIYYYYY